MVRRSLLAAALAGMLSLLLHGLGLNVASTDLPSRPDGAQTPPPETGAAFEEFAEPTPEAPPPEVTEPDPVEAVEPTSNALVASDTPQSVMTPDTGDAQALAPEAAPQETQAPDAPEPPQSAEVPETVAEAPPAEPAEPETPPETTPETAAEAPDPAPEALAPDLPDDIVASLPEDLELPEETGDGPVMDTAVTTSLRPPKARPSAEALAARAAEAQEGAEGSGTTPVIQGSSLDLLSRETIISTSRATGNAGMTNYAGKVLTQLNQRRRVSTTGEGSARVQFQIDPDGSVAWVRILRSSGSQGIDRAAADERHAVEVGVGDRHPIRIGEKDEDRRHLVEVLGEVRPGVEGASSRLAAISRRDPLELGRVRVGVGVPRPGVEIGQRLLAVGVADDDHTPLLPVAAGRSPTRRLEHPIEHLGRHRVRSQPANGTLRAHQLVQHLGL
ncbi:MAG: energy transducer TonB [Roseovarius sp.]